MTDPPCEPLFPTSPAEPEHDTDPDAPLVRVPVSPRARSCVQLSARPKSTNTASPSSRDASIGTSNAN